jgi:hypothetical protein
LHEEGSHYLDDGQSDLEDDIEVEGVPQMRDLWQQIDAEHVVKNRYSLVFMTILSNAMQFEWFVVGFNEEFGRTVFAQKAFAPGTVLCELIGEILYTPQLKKYIESENAGLLRDHHFDFFYIVEGDAANPRIAIQAQSENNTMGRLINQVRPGCVANCKTHRLQTGLPRVVFVATTKILPGDELLCDFNNVVVRVAAEG